MDHTLLRDDQCKAGEDKVQQGKFRLDTKKQSLIGWGVQITAQVLQRGC